MDQTSLVTLLSGLPVSELRFYSSIDSTNDEAWRWVDAGAPHNALVVADEQTAGRGRLHRRWVTAAGASLAFSLALLSPPLDSRWLPRLTGLGALAACLELENHHARSAEIKWPNDILLGGQKAGGVLVETRWQGTQLRAVVVGVGINIASQSINPQVLPPGELNFPATCVEAALGQAVDRMDLLHGILKEFFLWQPKLGTPEFLHAWEDHLAFRGCWVELRTDAGLRATSPQAEPALPAMGRLDGLAEDGSLRLVDPSGNPFTVQSAEIHLRPAGNPL